MDFKMPLLLVFSKNPDPDRITSPIMEREEGVVYDLSGRRIGNRQLMPGLYIIGGKKIVIR